VAIQDRGTGIPAEHLPYIFERFYRVSTSRDRQSGGAGLGLAIVRSLVQAQGGRITAESAVGQGTTITFWLPVAETDTQLPHN
jgi:signal transduction histidine kinase